MLKKILIGVGAFIAAVVLISYILPGHYKLERSTVIKASPEKIFPQINNFKNWQSWMIWAQRDKNMQLTYTGPEAAVGMKSSWKSKTEGDGEMTLTASDPNKSISYGLYFPEFDSRSSGSVTLAPVDGGTKVTWTNEGDAGMNPMNRYFAQFMDKMVGPDFEGGLANLKAKVEAMPNAIRSFEVVTVEAMNALTLRATTKQETEAIGQTLGASYAEIGKAMKATGLKMASAPFAIYHKFSKDGVELEAGMAVEKLPTKVLGSSTVKAVTLPKTKALLAHYYGPYSGMQEANKEVDAYLATNHLEKAGPMWDSYITDPMSEKDSTKWYTKMYFPIK